MAEAYKERKKPTIIVSPVARKTESEPHSSIDVLSRAADVRSREIHTTVARADISTRALTNKEKYDNPANPISRRFAALMERV
ncbi:MAG: hypothetical protein ABH842_02450 [Candidatus Micrarchaeota archaeon]